MIKHILALGMVAGVVALSVAGCDEAEEEITATLDCGRLCEDWNDCFADTDEVDVDITDCTDTCEDRADANDAFREAVDDCQDCIDDTDNECGACWARCPEFPIPLE